MIRSMTGFGDAGEQVDGVHYGLELRSLNNRYFKAAIRLPEAIAGLEAELESELRKRLHRGSVTLTASMADAGVQATQKINDEALLAYLDRLETVHQRFAKTGKNLTIDLTALLGLPGVLEAADEGELLRKVRPVFLRLLDRATEKLLAMRMTEGKLLGADLRKQVEVIRTRLQDIKARSPFVVEEYHARLRARVDELLKRAELSVNQVDLVREVAVFAERADISEELSRLAGHLEQMEKLVQLADGEPAGRTLEFVGQELLREANTIGSKSNDALISRAVVEIKTAIDRIKEQSANVE